MILQNAIKEFQYQSREILAQIFTNTWHDILQSENLEKIDAFLTNPKTKKRVSKIKKYNEGSFYFMNMDLAKAVGDNDIERTKKLINVGLDINLEPTLFANFLRNSKKLKEKEVLSMLDLLLENNLNIYKENYKKYEISPIHNVLESIALHKYFEHNRKIEYFSKEDDERFIKNSTYYLIFKILKDKINSVSLAEDENLVELALKTKSQIIIKDVLKLPYISYEYIQKGLQKVEDNEDVNMIDEFLVLIEKKRLESNISLSTTNKKQNKI